MRPVFSDFDVWSFSKDDRGHWKWRRESPDGELLLESRSLFDDLDACVQDARRCGYSGSFTVEA